MEVEVQRILQSHYFQWLGFCVLYAELILLPCTSALRRFLSYCIHER